MSLRRWLDCARLNARVVALAGSRQWVRTAETAASYDRLALQYDANWQRHLAPVTLNLLKNIAEAPDGILLDLGCGTGFATAWCAARWPARSIRAVDLSEGMLEVARRRCAGRKNVRFERADLLEFLRRQGNASVAMIVAAWSIGYSRPSAVIERSARVLRAGGRLAFVVNAAESLSAVRQAFRRTMGRFPGELHRLAWPRFPRGAAPLRRALRRAKLAVEWWREDALPIVPTLDERGRVLPWLLNTGVLAGFDAMLPLADEGPAAEYFEACLQDGGLDLRHHYLAGIAVKPVCDRASI